MNFKIQQYNLMSKKEAKGELIFHHLMIKRSNNIRIWYKHEQGLSVYYTFQRERGSIKSACRTIWFRSIRVLLTWFHHSSFLYSTRKKETSRGTWEGMKRQLMKKKALVNKHHFKCHEERYFHLNVWNIFKDKLRNCWFYLKWTFHHCIESSVWICASENFFHLTQSFGCQGQEQKVEVAQAEVLSSIWSIFSQKRTQSTSSTCTIDHKHLAPLRPLCCFF